MSKGFEIDELVGLTTEPGLVYRVHEIQLFAGPDWYIHKQWTPRARVHAIGGANIFRWEQFAKWAPLENLIKLNPMEVIGRMAK